MQHVAVHQQVLSLAAFLGNAKLCRLLIQQGAQFTSRDRAGLTPLHYAAYQGMLQHPVHRVPITLCFSTVRLPITL